MGQALSTPLTSKVITRKGTKTLKITACEMQGKRLTMEDSTSIHLDFRGDNQSNNNVSFCGVFDGHGGGNASVWIADQLPKVLATSTSLEKDNIIQACLDTDKAYFEHTQSNANNNSNATRNDNNNNGNNNGNNNRSFDMGNVTEAEEKDGTTAVFAMIEETTDPDSNNTTYKVIIGNIGDSRALIIRGTPTSDGANHPSTISTTTPTTTSSSSVKSSQITEDHKPTRRKERDRIVAAGGAVVDGRVEGDLSLSRAFGDFDYKQKTGVSPENQPVIAVPDVFVLENVSPDDMILLFCDGLYEGSSNNAIAVSLKRNLKKSPNDSGQALGDMLDELAPTTEDNMSCILIQFTDGSEYSTLVESGEKEYRPMQPERMVASRRKFVPKHAEQFVNAFLGFEKRYNVASVTNAEDLLQYLKMNSKTHSACNSACSSANNSRASSPTFY